MDTNAKTLSFQAIMRWSEHECRDFLVAMRWPNGVICPKCGAEAPYELNRRSNGKNKVCKLWKCRACRRQFSVTVGTIFEDSKIPLSKWFAAIYQMCSSKKGISAHQLHRQLEITYKSAWFMCHRVREAMSDKSGDQLKGIIESDETYMVNKTQRGHKIWRERVKDEIDMGMRKKPVRRVYQKERPIVFGMLERGGRGPDHEDFIGIHQGN